MLINTLAVLIHLTVGAIVVRRHREHLVLWGYFFFLQSWALASCWANDLGIYNPELYRYTETTLATTRLALFFVLFNVGFLLMGALISNRPLRRRLLPMKRAPRPYGHFRVIVYTAVALMIAGILYGFGQGGIPLFADVHRIEYLEQANPIERFLHVYGHVLAFILGFFHDFRRRISPQLMGLIALILFSLFTGNKFSAILATVVPFLTAVYIRKVAQGWMGQLLRLRTIAIAGTTIIVFTGLAFGTYLKGTGNTRAAAAILVSRVVANQGQMWWATDHQLLESDGFERGHWSAELKAIVAQGDVDPASYGMRYLMLQILGPQRAFPIFDQGYLYTMGFPAILVASFPYWLAMMAQVIAGMVFFVLLYYLYYAVLYRHLFRSIAALILTFYYLSMTLHGDFILFFNWRSALLLIFVVLCEVILPPFHASEIQDEAGSASRQVNIPIDSSDSAGRQLDSGHAG
jgi:hypothetical protein